MKPYKIIEPVYDTVYEEDIAEYGVYEMSVFPRHSVLRGQESKVQIAVFRTLKEAQEAYPKAEVYEDVQRIHHDIPHYFEDDPYEVRYRG